jgi:hypothetical protein
MLNFSQIDSLEIIKNPKNIEIPNPKNIEMTPLGQVSFNSARSLSLLCHCDSLAQRPLLCTPSSTQPQPTTTARTKPAYPLPRVLQSRLLSSSPSRETRQSITIHDLLTIRSITIFVSSSRSDRCAPHPDNHHQAIPVRQRRPPPPFELLLHQLQKQQLYQTNTRDTHDHRSENSLILDFGRSPS